MDEIFGEVGFAKADVTLKARIEREIGLTALLGDQERNASISGADAGPVQESTGLETKVKDDYSNEIMEEK